MAYDRDEDYIVDLDSDIDEAVDSSEDEIDVILHGTPEQKRRWRRKSLGKASSSEDEFEKEMNEELDKTVKGLEEQQKTNVGSSTLPATSQVKEVTFYEDEYFDSDSDEEATSDEKKKKKHPKPTNDELFYDPNIDDDDQRWVDSNRRQYQPTSKKPNSTHKTKDKKESKLPRSDAVLNCPACMTTLCRDCQRHEKFKSQYRAMFVTNCIVDTSERLKYPVKGKAQKRQKLGTDASETDQSEDLYNPVKCTECNTEVGVYDKEEIFHFFNVLASY